ncbi:MAG TPA: enoyl-CoA hydratase [Deltaproteobacteria bacterium]|nr:enoyl-CoA hydratase [Deltaproteobacteria bacterium]
MEYKNIVFGVEERVGIITLNRPEKRNALSLELMQEMINLLRKLQANRDIHVVILKGNGPAFCAGHDMAEMVGEDKGINQFRKIFSVCTEMMLLFHKIPQPVIAQVHGIATAAGCQLVAACDMAIASDEARFATPGVKIGLFCTTPMVPLVRAIGRKRAMKMLLTGEFITADEAERFGLVNEVVPAEKLEKRTREFASEIAAYSGWTVGIGKEAFYNQIDMEEKEAYFYAKEVIASNCLTYDAQEGMRAFLEKRKPVWKNK